MNIDFILQQTGDDMFGVKVTNYIQVSNNTDGYTVKLSFSQYGNEGIEFGNFFEAQAANVLTYSNVIEPITDREIQNFFNSDINDNPDFAFSVDGENALLYFKSSVFPYEDDTTFALWGKRHPLKLVDNNSLIDIPNSLMGLYDLYVEQEIQRIKGYNTIRLDRLIQEVEREYEDS